MTLELRRVCIRDGNELLSELAELRKDRSSRLVVDENGRVLGVLLDPEAYSELTAIPKSRIHGEEIRALIGSYSGADADAMISAIERWRDESPPSPDPAQYFEEDAESKR